MGRGLRHGGGHVEGDAEAESMEEDSGEEVGAAEDKGDGEA